MILTGLLPIGAFLLSAGATFGLNWLSLIPWRRNKDKHWTEQARFLAPVSAAARSNLFMIPAAFALAVTLFWPSSSPLWLFAGISSLIGALGGTLFFDHEVFPRIPMNDLLRQIVIGWVMQLIIWLVFITVIVLMPNEFNIEAWIGAGAAILLWRLWTWNGWIWTGRKLGLFLPAPERLRKIIDETSSRMNIPYQEILLIRSSFPQAYAVPGKGTLLFTARLLEICSDEEIAAICAHELAHLTESRPARYSRLVRSLSYMPWIFFRPLLALYGIGAFLGLLAITVTVPRIYGSISCKLESRADSMAKTHEGDEGTYARALTRLYEDRLIPAVGPKRNATHPDLYDRLAAAGITPDFPRPLPPGKMAWHGRVFGIIAGLLFGIFAVRFMQSFNSLN